MEVMSTSFLSFFSWRAIIDHLMTHDKTTFRDLMSRFYQSLVIFSLPIMTLDGFRPELPDFLITVTLARQ